MQMFLHSYRTYQKFRQKLLAKLNQHFQNGMDTNSDTYKIFLECSEIPLRGILNDFCLQQEDIVERILKDEELCNAFNYYYYCKYLTNSDLAVKYPVKVKKSQEASHVTNAQIEINNANENTKESIDRKVPQENVNKSTAAECKDSLEKSLENTIQEKKALEKAKRIFFRHVDRVKCLIYFKSYGSLKQLFSFSFYRQIRFRM